jgi:hypothetical protein
MAAELRAIATTLDSSAKSLIWQGEAFLAFAEKLGRTPPNLRSAATRYEGYSAALRGYADQLGPAIARLGTERRALLLAMTSGTNDRPISGPQPSPTFASPPPLIPMLPSSAQLAADMARSSDLFDKSQRFKTSYDCWADALDRCVAAITAVNNSDPLRDPHGWKAAQYNAGKLAHDVKAFSNLSDVLGLISSVGSAIGLILLVCFPPAGAFVLGLVAVVSLLQVGIDCYRKFGMHDKTVSSWDIGLEGLGSLPGGALAKGAGAAVKGLPDALSAAGAAGSQAGSIAAGAAHIRGSFTSTATSAWRGALDDLRGQHVVQAHERRRSTIAKKFLWTGGNAALGIPEAYGGRGTSIPELAHKAGRATYRKPTILISPRITITGQTVTHVGS